MIVQYLYYIVIFMCFWDDLKSTSCCWCLLGFTPNHQCWSYNKLNLHTQQSIYVIAIAIGAQGCYNGYSHQADVKDFVMIAEHSLFLIHGDRKLRYLQLKRNSGDKLELHRITNVMLPSANKEIDGCYAVAADLSPKLYFYREGHNDQGVYQGTYSLNLICFPKFSIQAEHLFTYKYSEYL